MEREKLESMLIDYIDGVLGEEETRIIEAHLEKEEASRVLLAQLREVIGGLSKSSALEPSWAMKARFDGALRDEIIRQNALTTSGREVVMRPAIFRAAAAVMLLMLVGAIAYWTIKNQRQQEEVAALRKEMEATRRIMMTMLEDQQSASTRMKGASVAFHMEKTDDEIVNVLVKTMNEDPSTNVRLAAMEALEKFNQQTHVRQALIASLSTQKDPIVQLALIQLMVRMKEKGALRGLENITNDVETMKAVKDEAYSGILKLS